MLRFEKINAYYGDVQVLHDVSLTVKKGEIVTIVGSNAAGKSTILKTVSGLIPKVEGTIWFQNRNLLKLPAHERAGIGVIQVPEGRRLFSQMTVRENLQMGAYAKRVRSMQGQTLEQIYKMLPPLKEKEKQTTGSLSGGEQQMVAIGRGLMARPNLLMLDEPTLGLAPKLVQWVFALIGEIRDTGVTILLVEQNANKALQIADRGYVLENGRIVLEGEGEKLLADPGLRKAYLGL